MEFNGTFELEDTTVDEVWLALSDPVLVKESLPGCEFLVQVEDEDVDFDALREQYADRNLAPTADQDVIAERAFVEGEQYAALVQISVGPVNPTFETVVTIDRREKPEMSASGEGSSGDSSFEMASSMALSETDDGVAVDWETQADVFGRVAQMGQRVVNPVANQVVKRFFSSVQQQLRDLSMTADAEAEAETTGAADAAGDADAGSTAAAEAASTGESDGESGGTEMEDDSGGSNTKTTASESAAESGGESRSRSLVDRLLGRSKGDEDT